MPKLIDHSQREVEVAEAAWRVLRRDGVTSLSVRNVAAEAGLATGSLRRAFPTQDALLAFSLELWRGAPADRAEPEQMVASGVLHAGLLSTLQALAGFWRTAPPTQRPLALLLHRGRPVWTVKAGFSHRSLRSR